MIVFNGFYLIGLAFYIALIVIMAISYVIKNVFFLLRSVNKIGR